MKRKKITDLPLASSLNDYDYFVVVDHGSASVETKKVSARVIKEKLKNEIAQGVQAQLSTNNFEGVTGEKGDTGDDGDIGELGLKGLRGFRGPVGDDGRKGSVGDVGDVGIKGSKGRKGSIGLDGLTGDSGERGYTGLAGEKGEAGQKGQTGNIGEFGEKGEKGNTGNTLVSNIKGDKGHKGLPGLIEIALPGDVGEIGDSGIKGSKGDKGDKGNNGLRLNKVQHQLFGAKTYRNWTKLDIILESDEIYTLEIVKLKTEYKFLKLVLENDDEEHKNKFIDNEKQFVLLLMIPGEVNGNKPVLHGTPPVVWMKQYETDNTTDENLHVGNIAVQPHLFFESAGEKMSVVLSCNNSIINKNIKLRIREILGTNDI